MTIRSMLFQFAFTALTTFFIDLLKQLLNKWWCFFWAFWKRWWLMCYEKVMHDGSKSQFVSIKPSLNTIHIREISLIKTVGGQRVQGFRAIIVFLNFLSYLINQDLILPLVMFSKMVSTCHFMIFFIFLFFICHCLIYHLFHWLPLIHHLFHWLCNI